MAKKKGSYKCQKRKFHGNRHTKQQVILEDRDNNSDSTSVSTCGTVQPPSQSDSDSALPQKDLRKSS